jgi:hypothetical protein
VVTEDVSSLNKKEAWWQKALRPLRRKAIQVIGVTPGCDPSGVTGVFV